MRQVARWCVRYVHSSGPETRKTMQTTNQPMRTPRTGDERTNGTPPVVVCLDDDRLVEGIFLAAAARAGVRGVFVTDAGAFERAVRALAPRAVVLDQVMPDSTGAELILWLRSLPAPPGVIAIGADQLYVDSAAALVKGAGLSCMGALRKPLQLSEFAHAIGEAVGAAKRGDPE